MADSMVMKELFDTYHAIRRTCRWDFFVGKVRSELITDEEVQAIQAASQQVRKAVDIYPERQILEVS